MKALVAKALSEQGLSTEPRTQIQPVGELALVCSPSDVRSSQGSTTSITVDRLREPASCTLLVPGRSSKVREVATGRAHPPGGVWHGNPIPDDYTRVEVHTVNPNYISWEIEYPTPEGLVKLGDVINQFILWHKKDIVLNVSSPTLSEVHMQLDDQRGDVYSPARGDHMTDEVPHSSQTPRDHVPEEKQTSPARHTEQVSEGMPQCSPAHHIEQGHDDMSQACPLEHGPDGE